MTSSGEQRVALELHGVDIEYGHKPRSADHDARTAAEPASEAPEEDIPF